jgi:hypothetical protein
MKDRFDTDYQIGQDNVKKCGTMSILLFLSWLPWLSF